MKIQRDKLHQYQRRITVLTDRETAIAKQMLAANDKPRALLALRRKKYQESLLAKTDAQLDQLEQLTRSVEFALIQKDIVFGLQQGTKVLQEIHKEMGGIEHVEKLMGETADAVAYQQVRTFLLPRAGDTIPFSFFGEGAWACPGDAEESPANPRVYAATAGSERHARRSHDESGRGRSRRRT